MPIFFIVAVEEDLSDDKVKQVMSDLEEVIGKHGLSIDYTSSDRE